MQLNQGTLNQEAVLIGDTISKEFSEGKIFKINLHNKKECNPLQPSNPLTAVLLNAQFPMALQILGNVMQHRLLPQVLY